MVRTPNRASYEALQDECRRLRQYLDGTDVLFVALSPQGTIEWINRPAQRLWGQESETLQGQNWVDVCLPPDVRDAARQTLERALTSDETMETEVWNARGERRWMTWRWQRLAEGAGVLCSGEDVTERRIAQQQLDIFSDHLTKLVARRTHELEVALASANAASEAKSLFLANMSHEIRTPMNAVLGFAQLLAQEPGLSSSGRHKVETIVRSGEHLLAIINDILEMSRIEAGRIELKVVPTPLADVIREVAQQFGPRAVEKGLVWEFASDPALPEFVETDPVRVRQVLTNLVSNAVKYTSHGGVSVQVTWSAPNTVIVDVVDTGIGIPPAERERLFQPFERTRAGQAVAGGTGLGLAICRRYAQLLGGDVSIVEGPSVGTCFRFRWTALAVEGHKVPVAASDLPRLKPAHWGTLVVLVDDLRSNRELLKGMLEPLGFEVLEAADGIDAVQLVEARAPRLVLMDLMMPGLDGYEATRRIRQTFSSQAVTIIGITASALDADRSHFESSGLDGFLAKPFRFAELHRLIAEHTDLAFELVAEPVAETVSGDKPPEAWLGLFRQALDQGAITRLRLLGDEARAFDPGLSQWIAERAARYALDELRGYLAHWEPQP